MLTTAPHAWILDTVERWVIAVPRADRENNELQMYGLTRFYISFLPRQGGSASYALPDDGGVRGDRKAPDPSGRQRGAIEARERSEWTARVMRVLSVRLRKPDISKEPMPGKRYVSLSALSGIFCRVGDDVLPRPRLGK